MTRGQLTAELVRLRKRVATLEAEQALCENERRYRDLFELSPVSIFIQNFHNVAEEIAEIRARGVDDLLAYLAETPGELQRLAKRLKTIDVNACCVAMFGAQDKAQLMSGETGVFDDGYLEVFRQQLMAIWEGKQQFETTAQRETREGRRIDCVVRMRAQPGCSGLGSSNVIVSIIDIPEELIDPQMGAAHLFLKSQEVERMRIARDIHDDIGQRLATQALHIGSLLQGGLISDTNAHDRLKDIHEAIVALARDVQAISRELHPSILDELGVGEAIRTECARIAATLDLEIECSIHGLPTAPNGDTALCLYRVFQEALSNVVHHAKARTVQLSVVAEGNTIVLDVRDDGSGFDLAKAGAGPGLGLVSMEERTRLVHGELSFDTEPGCGTHLRLRVPTEAMAP